MARVVGIFRDDAAVDAVVDQLAINRIDHVTLIRPADVLGESGDDVGAVQQRLRGLGVPAEMLDEYHTRLQRDLRLILVQTSATDLPTVQRAFRNAQAVDIDLLPEPGA